MTLPPNFSQTIHLNIIHFLSSLLIPHAFAFTQLLLLLLLLKEVSTARLRESDIHPISPKTPAPQYQPIDRKKRKGKIVEDYSRDRAAQLNKKALALFLKSARPTPSNTGSARSFQRDTERGTSPTVLRGSAAKRA